MGALELTEAERLAHLAPEPVPAPISLLPLCWALWPKSLIISSPSSSASCSGLFCEHPPPMVLLQTSPCDQYECQNGAQCIVVQQEPTCRCPPGFAGPRCEKLITVNFVGKDSYVELASAKVRPQANISLQVRPHRSPRGDPSTPSSDCCENSWDAPDRSSPVLPPQHLGQLRPEGSTDSS